MPSSTEMEAVDESKFGVPSLRAVGLRKVFHSNGIEKIAVHDMSLDVYEGQVCETPCIHRIPIRLLVT